MNELLVALLPILSGISSHLGYPDPITREDILAYQPSKKPAYHAAISLKNGHFYRYQNGTLRLFSSASTFYDLPDIPDLSKFYGSQRISREQAIGISRTFVQKLGYNLNEVFMDLPPSQEEGPIQYKQKKIPRYSLIWNEPRGTAAKFEVNGESGFIERAYLMSPNFQRSPGFSLPISFDEKTHAFWSTNSVPPDYRDALVKRVLPEINLFASKMKLPVRMPILPKSIRTSHAYKTTAYMGASFPSVYLEIETQDEDRFIYCNGRVTEFYDRSAISFNNRNNFPASGIYGDWKMSEREALKFARDSLIAAGYPLKALGLDDKPQIVAKQPPLANKIIPRYFMNWYDNKSKYVSIELDADRGQILGICLKALILNKELPQLEIELD